VYERMPDDRMDRDAVEENTPQHLGILPLAFTISASF
jgi:hypothetical protein